MPELPDVVVYIEALERRIVGQTLQRIRLASPFLLRSVDPPIDAIVKISFDSPEEMRKALEADSYKRAHEARQRYMQETSVGIHSAVVDETVKLV